MGQRAARTLTIWCPHWPVVAAAAAAGVGPDEPAVVVHANRVVAASPAARHHGITSGLRRREAQGRCPEVVVCDHDPARDARAFEPVAAAVATLTPRVELTRPGSCAIATRGPSRYFGGDDALARRAAELVTAVLEGMPASQGARRSREGGGGGRAGASVAAQALAGAAPPLIPGSAKPASQRRASVGVADGPFAAALAARRAGTDPLVVPSGGSAAFLAPLGVRALTVGLGHAAPAADLVDVLVRLGLGTLGEVAALPAVDVLARFGTIGARAHRLARGLDEHPPATRAPPPDLSVATELDPPAERVDQAAFVAKALADDLHALSARGLACSRVRIEAETTHGERHERVWRHEGTLDAGAIADRVRWQLDGWLQVPGAAAPTGGISRLALVPEEVVAARGRQLGFWGEEAAATERALRALARVQGLLGPEAVTVPERRGGRGPGEQVSRVPAAAVDLSAPRPSARSGWVREPWPGRLPAPAPATVHPVPVPAEVVAADGAALGVSARGVLSAVPARVSVAGARWVDVVAWAGPWPAEERWWDLARARRRARLQVVDAAGTARLLTLEAGTWAEEAKYE